jgi:hypothetical protein
MKRLLCRLGIHWWQSTEETEGTFNFKSVCKAAVRRTATARQCGHCEKVVIE